MNSLLELSWLIPLAPFAGALLIFLLLISFERTINRLTKPVSYLMIACLSLSTILSTILYTQHLEGELPIFRNSFLGYDFDLMIYADSLSEITSILLGGIFLIVLITSLLRLNRQKGYVRYFVTLGFLSSFLFYFVLVGSYFHDLFSFT